ncbi:hypothetical protein D6T64_10450 [Cryobacterium melibiosiphilum]|uniref:WXG100 family type VII secretion target n=1 Tax=Cryobacterium melibiosiphilum TaxID=995039 RepID=A0A3A5MN30_9MICO|nr:hypothetical protein [Cryobacterium melibiosiphilum]RJT88538.1 hypothetical protein D6T64_10450 [Cryobacterium melibiosiphilum]
MADLKVSTAILELVGTDLASILTEFESAEGIAASVAGATGHRELEERVVDFAGSWDDKRADMIEQITALVGQITAISDAFLQVDSELAQALDASEQTTVAR